jgi:hypothetical protein
MKMVNIDIFEYKGPYTALSIYLFLLLPLGAQGIHETLV